MPQALTSKHAVTHNQPTVKDNGLILGTTQPSGTIEHVQIISGSRMGIVWLHVLTALAAVLVVVSLAIPPKWIQGGKSGLANFQRSGILTLIFAGISMIMCFVTFGTYYGLVQTLKKNFNAVPGISANWSGSCIMWVSTQTSGRTSVDRLCLPFLLPWFADKSLNRWNCSPSPRYPQYVLPCGILYIPAFLTVLLPTYVRPVEEDDDESAPMAPLASPHMPQSNSMNKSVESFGSGARTPVGANSPFPKVPAMYTGK